VKFFNVEIVEGEQRGRYRMMANTAETAGQRAQVCFKNEFGVNGRVEKIDEVQATS
jgi:hypothetical protein